MKALLVLLAPLLAGCVTSPPPAALDAPLVDYHQHLVSPAFAPIVKAPERDGRALVAELDAAGVRQAVVLSVGYSFADERKKLPDPDGLTRAENDWTSLQVATSGGRLVGFCSSNPLREAALQELERCLGLPGMVGIKQHWGNAGLSLRKPDHLKRMTLIFALAERRRVPILVHMRARGGENFGAEDAQLTLDHLVPAAPSIDIMIAHLGASSPGYPDQNDEVMAVFGAAVERGDPRMRNVYFDVAANVSDGFTPADGKVLAPRLRQVGLERILYGSDLSAPGGSIRAGWDIFRARSQLTDAELQVIAANRLRFLR